MNTRFLIHVCNPVCKVRMAMSKTDWRSAADIAKLSGEGNTLRVSKLIFMYSREFGGIEKIILNNTVFYRLTGNMVLNEYEKKVVDLLRDSNKPWTPNDICKELNLPYTNQYVGGMLMGLMADYPILKKKVKMYHTYEWNHEEE